MPASNPIYENVCLRNGHALALVYLGHSVFDVASKSLIDKKEVLCTRCGMSLEEVRNSKTAVRRRRSAKPQEGVIPTEPEREDATAYVQGEV